MQYVLLTVRDKDLIVRAFDCIATPSNQYEMRESCLTGFGEIATTIYSQNEYKDWMDAIASLSTGIEYRLVTRLNILRESGVSQWI